VTTGQNVSNLPPILECATPGKDAVLWLESDKASELQWSKGAIDVLKRRGFDRVECMLLPEDPGEIWIALSKVYERCERDGYAVQWVANGGSKPTSIAIQASQPKLSAALPILYSEPQPVEYWLMPDGITGPRHKRRYEKARLSLEEVLAARGHFIKNPQTATKIWPDNAHGRLSTSDAYGIDRKVVGQAHQDASRRQELREQTRAAELGEPISLDCALQECPEHVTGWLEGAWNTARSIARSTPAKPGNWPDFGSGNAEQLGGLFVNAQKAADRIRNELRNGQGRNRAAPEQDRNPLGPRFEQAVACRVRSWLEAQKETLPVNEAWLNVKIATQRNRSRIVQELDIILVLANAVLISLECKTFQADRKDLDARLLNIRRSGSQLARLVVCAPLYTDFSTAPWFKNQHALAKTLKDFGFQYIPFTLPDQPRSYRIAGRDGASEAFDCPPFEDQLDRLMKPYVPQWREVGRQRPGNVT